MSDLLPPSLAVKPNIPLSEQTLDQLVAERDYWAAKIDAATGWGAGYSAAWKFHRACVRALQRRGVE